MALWMEPGQEPTTEAERADLDAIEALRESCALELKEEGNEFLKKGKQFYSRALDSYTRGIDQGCSNELTNSVLYANRAQVNLLLGNFRRALSDAEESIRRNPTNLKAYFRGAKASIELGLLSEAGRFCSDGLLQDADNKELRKILDQVDREVVKDAEKKKWALEARSKAEALFSALSSRRINLGDPLYEERSQSRRPWLDSSQILHWPVLLLYGEVRTSDLVEDFCEIETFAVHLDDMFGKDAPPLVWDERHEYTRDGIALYYYANAYEPLSRKKALDVLSGEGAGYERTTAEDDESEETTSSTASRRAPSWIQVSENETLSSVLSRGNHIIPGIPGDGSVMSGICRFWFPAALGELPAQGSGPHLESPAPTIKTLKIHLQRDCVVSHSSALELWRRCFLVGALLFYKFVPRIVGPNWEQAVSSSFPVEVGDSPMKL